MNAGGKWEMVSFDEFILLSILGPAIRPLTVLQRCSTKFHIFSMGYFESFLREPGLNSEISKFIFWAFWVIFALNCCMPLVKSDFLSRLQTLPHAAVRLATLYFVFMSVLQALVLISLQSLVPSPIAHVYISALVHWLALFQMLVIVIYW